MEMNVIVITFAAGFMLFLSLTEELWSISTK